MPLCDEGSEEGKLYFPPEKGQGTLGGSWLSLCGRGAGERRWIAWAIRSPFPYPDNKRIDALRSPMRA
jgi:hypothetical protein